MRISFVTMIASLIAAGNVCSATIVQDVTIDFVTVGDPGNSPDTTGYGSVGYEYLIGKYEVTLDQYCAFLNAVAATDTYGLYISKMGGRILRAGNSGSYTYSVSPGLENHPANYIDWYRAARFCNWMSNGQPSGEQNSLTTEDGAYDMDGDLTTHKPDASVWLPTEDEWYKAAFYKGGGSDAGYWEYATQSDICPTATIPPGDDNSANYNWIVQGIGLTDVGSYIWSESAYGTFDQAGSVWEWNEATDGLERGARGGSFATSNYALPASFRDLYSPTGAGGGAGFRIASIPEPATPMLLGLGALIIRKRKPK